MAKAHSIVIVTGLPCGVKWAGYIEFAYFCNRQGVAVQVANFVSFGCSFLYD